MKSNIIVGYKAFNEGLINNYNKEFDLNKIYTIDGKIKYGLNGNGYHMCLNLEDTLRYYQEKEVNICLAVGFGDYEIFNDEYYGYYNMYSVENILLVKKLSRKEIINYMKNTNVERIKRFISLYKLTDSEIIEFKNINEEIDNYIDYYQYNKKDVFTLKKRK